MFRSLVFMMLLCLHHSVTAKQFDFVALGDTAYNLPQDIPVYENLIQVINETKPEFSIHVGDTWGAMPCTDDKQRWILSWFEKYQQPLIYTPGDNEWTDCRKPEALKAYMKMLEKKATKDELMMLARLQSFDSELAGESFVDSNLILENIRQVFFSKPESLGAKRLKLTRQADESDYKEMVENARWSHQEVSFATINVPGSDMNFTINNEARAIEAIRRNKANVAWVKQVFAKAKADKSKAVVLAIHASLFVDGSGGEFSNHKLRGGMGGPYYWITRAIKDEAAAFEKPVLLINGDFHEFVIDQPFRVDQGEGEAPKFDNITRLQVYGAPDIRAVKVSVDTSTPWVFGFSPLY